MSEHGTVAGYQAHYRHGEEPCEPCKDARKAYVRGRAIPNSTREKKRQSMAAYYAAVRELIANHRAEYLALRNKHREQS